MFKTILKKVVHLLQLGKRENELRKSDDNRECHWLIEDNGEVIGELQNPQYYDMFWVRYDLLPFVEEARFKDELWLERPFTFRNKVTNNYAPNAFPSVVVPVVKGGKVIMRGLYECPNN